MQIKKKEISEDLGEFLERFRDERKISKAEFSRMMGITSPRYRRFLERGKGLEFSGVVGMFLRLGYDVKVVKTEDLGEMI